MTIRGWHGKVPTPIQLVFYVLLIFFISIYLYVRLKYYLGIEALVTTIDSVPMDFDIFTIAYVNSSNGFKVCNHSTMSKVQFSI